MDALPQKWNGSLIMMEHMYAFVSGQKKTQCTLPARTLFVGTDFSSFHPEVFVCRCDCVPEKGRKMHQGCVNLTASLVFSSES